MDGYRLAGCSINYQQIINSSTSINICLKHCAESSSCNGLSYNEKTLTCTEEYCQSTGVILDSDSISMIKSNYSIFKIIIG